MKTKKSYSQKFKQYHGNDVWGRFLEWLEKKNKVQRKKNG